MGKDDRPLRDKNNDEKDEIISSSVVTADVCTGRK